MFGEKTKEYSAKRKEELPVWISPKYEQAKEKAKEIIKDKPYIKEGDFWILMNETKSGKMGYTGLIISHNACLKLNDNAPKDNRFVPTCVFENQNGYNNELVFTYINEAQGIYEVGEVSKDNCKNEYPYAMAFKRLFDRVVLKLNKLAYDGIYSDSEADEFKEPEDEKSDKVKVETEKTTQSGIFCQKCGEEILDKKASSYYQRHPEVEPICQKCFASDSHK